MEVLTDGRAHELAYDLRTRMEVEIGNGSALLSTSVPSHEAILRRLTVPFERMDRVAKVLPSLLDVQLPFPLENCCCSFVKAGAVRSGSTEVLAVAALRDDLQRCIERSRDVGFDPVLLDHEGLALWWLAGRDVGPAPAEGRVIIHLGRTHTSVVYGNAQLPAGAHGIRGAPDAVQLGARIRAILAAQSSANRVALPELILSGPGAGSERFASDLQSELGVTSARVVDAPMTFLARALALRALHGDALDCNLRKDGLLHPMARRATEGALRRTVMLAVTASLSLMVVSAASIFFAAARADKIQSEIQRLAAEAGGAGAPRGQEVLVVRRVLEQRRADLEPLQNLVSPTASRRVGDLLALCRTNGATVAQLAVTARTLRMEIAPTHSGGAEIITRALSENGWKPRSQKIDGLIILEAER